MNSGASRDEKGTRGDEKEGEKTGIVVGEYNLE